MLIYNTTYHVPTADARNFVIWLHEFFIPETERQGILRQPRLSRILSHTEEDAECFSLQFEVDDSAALHRWYVAQGSDLNKQLLATFQERVAGFSTLMEVINPLDASEREL